MKRWGTLYLLSGPSGVGKSTLVANLLKSHKCSNLHQVITSTTREPRMGERNGVDYNFISQEIFLKMIENGEFLEHACVHGHHFYGSPRRDVETLLEGGKDVLLVIDTAGVNSIISQNLSYKVVTIFMRPKSIEVLRERILARKTDSEDSLSIRLKTAEKEMDFAARYDFIIDSDTREQVLADFVKIYQATR